MSHHALPMAPPDSSSADADTEPVGRVGRSRGPSRPESRLPRAPWHVPHRCRRRTAAAPADLARQERECLAQLLHDQLGGLLVQLRLAYGAWRHGALPVHQPSGTVQDRLLHPGAAFDGLLSELSDTVRRLTFALAPPDWHDDLPAALESAAAELGLRSKLGVRLDTTELRAEGAPAVPAPLRAVVCRVVRELGLNVQKHAGASSVVIHARPVAGRLWVSVEDDGCGLPCEAGNSGQGLGLRSARAQLKALGGDLTLRSLPDRGTCATLTLPFDAAPADLA